jgi:aspartyl-tRNA(Asn)/glutamyl-tRNA(Gln) amidotransferase subunit A
LIAPTWRTPAPRIEVKHTLGHATKEDALNEFGLERAYGIPFAIAGTPALALPCGFNRAGLPLSIQIIAKPFRDDVALQVGHAYQRATAWHTRRPALSEER